MGQTLQNFLHSWRFDPTIVLGAAGAAVLYVRGSCYSRQHGIRVRLRWERCLSFALGLAAFVLALESPIDTASEQYFWVHMLQHEILTMVVAPLLVFGAPALPLLRALPLAPRRTLLRFLARHARLPGLRPRLARELLSPPGVWLLFVGDFAFWHLPPLYDLTLQEAPIHYLEHALFLVTGIMFWAHIIPSPPFALRGSLSDRAVFLGLVALAGNLFDVIFIASPAPIYGYYAALPRHAGTMPALVDQSVAAGIMGAASALILIAALLMWRRSFVAPVPSMPTGSSAR